jgi:hypothetical protein
MVSNSRRNAVSALLALSAAVMLGSSPGNGALVQASRSPRLRVRRGKPGPAPAKHRARMTLFLASLPARKRRALLDEIEGLLASLVARRHPLLVDFAEESPERVAREIQPGLLPLLSAASSLVAGVWSAPDGLVVEALPTGVESADSVAAWRSKTLVDRELRRARFLAWPVSCSLLIQFPSVVEVVRASTALREQTVTEGSRFALVVDRDTKLGIAHFAEWEEYVALAKRVRRFAAREAAGTLLESLASIADPAAGDLLPWLSLDRNELLLVPRMSVIADERGLVDQVLEVMRRADVRAQILNAPQAR